MNKKLKIYNQTMGPNYTEVPTIILKGKWLEEAGFKAGEYVEVNVENEVIIITKTDPPEKYKKTLQEKIDGLSDEQKKKLSKLIDEI